MKPGEALQTTGILPASSSRATSRAVVSAAVAAAGDTSTMGTR